MELQHQSDRPPSASRPVPLNVDIADTGLSRPVALLDDSAAICDAVTLLFRSVDIKVVAFQEPMAFLNSDLEQFGCILLDVRLPHMSGVQTFKALRERNVQTPVIFLTGHGDIPMAVRAMQDGAQDFLEKPVDDHTLIECVLGALSRDSEMRKKRAVEETIRDRLAKLTPREREIADLVIQGKTSKEIATKISLSVRTVEHHRIVIGRNLEVDSIAELVRILDKHGK